MVRQRAYRILGERTLAEDVTQDTFLKYLQHRQRGGEADQAGAYLYKTVSNLALNQLRDRKTRRRLLEQKVVAPEPQTPRYEETLALRKVLANARKRDAQVASYYYLDNLKQEEISELLSIPRRTVSYRLARFRADAARLLKR